MNLIDLVTSIYYYYESFWKIFWRNDLPTNDLDLFHWSLHTHFILWPKNENCSFKAPTKWFKLHPMSKYVFNRWVIIIISLLGPFVILYLAIMDDKIFLECFQDPSQYWYYFLYCAFKGGKRNPQFINMMRNISKYGRASRNPISGAYNLYIYHISQNESILIDNKHFLYLWSQKHSIPVIPCMTTANDLNKYHTNQEFIIKQSDGCRGIGTFSTKNAQKYLSQIPNVVIQPRLKNHESIIDFTQTPNTLCTFRVCTYTKESNLQTEAWLSVARKDGNLTDTHVSAAYIYDIEKGIFSKRLESEYPMIIASKNKNDIYEITIDGLNEFIVYLTNIHHKYLDDIIGLGWDMTKISNGKWVIVECNTFAGYYYSKKLYAERTRQAFINKIALYKR